MLMILFLQPIAQGSQEIGKIPTEEDCMGLIAVLPTFRSEAMTAWYEKGNQSGLTGKQVVEKIQSLAEAGDKELQFTYGTLLTRGYCVPKDLCAGLNYIKLSRGGKMDWEKIYPTEQGAGKCN